MNPWDWGVLLILVIAVTTFCIMLGMSERINAWLDDRRLLSPEQRERERQMRRLYQRRDQVAHESRPLHAPQVLRSVERPNPPIDLAMLRLSDDGELPQDFDDDPQRVAWTAALRGLRRHEADSQQE